MTMQNLVRLKEHYKKILATPLNTMFSVNQGIHGVDQDAVIVTYKISVRNHQDAQKNLDDLYKKYPALRDSEPQKTETSKKGK